MTASIGDLFTHVNLGGLYIVIHDRNRRYGLRCFESGKMRWINYQPFPHHYKPVSQEIT